MEAADEAPERIDVERPRARIAVPRSWLPTIAAPSCSAGSQHNVGQFMREQEGDATFLLDFTTYEGTVVAAKRGGWGNLNGGMSGSPA
jgi:erythromycin esterase-like protein